MKIGLVKWYDKQKGYGVIGTPECEYFLHQSNIIDKNVILTVGTAIVFKEFVNKNGKLNAINPIVADNYEDFSLIMEYLGKNDIVKIKDKDWNNDEEKLSLKKKSLKFIFINKSRVEILDFSKKYYKENHLNNKIEKAVDYLELIRLTIQSLPEIDNDSTWKELISSFNKEELNIELLFSLWEEEDSIYYDLGSLNIDYDQYGTRMDKSITIDFYRVLRFKNGKELLSKVLKSKLDNLKLTSDLNDRFIKLKEIIDVFHSDRLIPLYDEFPYDFEYLELFNLTIQNIVKIIKSDEELFKIIKKYISNSYYNIDNVIREIIFPNKDISKALNNYFSLDIFNQILKFWRFDDKFEYPNNTIKLIYLANLLGLDNSMINPIFWHNLEIILTELSDLNKFNIIDEYFNSNEYLLKKCLLELKFDTYLDIDYFLSRIKKLSFTKDEETTFISRVLTYNNRLNYSSAILLFTQYPYEIIFDTLISLIDFSVNNIDEFLLKITRSPFYNENKKALLKNKFLDYSITIDYKLILDIYNKDTERCLIEDSEEFLSLLITKKLSLESIEQIFNQYKYQITNQYLYKILINNIDEIKYHDISYKILITNLDSKFEKILFNLLFNESSITSWNINHFFEYIFDNKIDKESITKCLNNIVDLNIKISSCYILKVSLEFGNILMSNYFLNNLEIKSRSDILDLIKYLLDDSKIRKQFFSLEDKIGVFDLSKFILNPSEFEVNEMFIKLIQNSEIGFEITIMNEIIKLFETKKIDIEKLSSFMQNIPWKSLNSLIIKTFIDSSIFHKILTVDSLNFLFASHFLILNEFIINKENYSKYFSIGNLIAKCNGRKKYRYKLWESGSLKRKYSDSLNDISLGEKVETKYCSYPIYCEGRFWKNELFWSSDQNKPFKEESPLFWCRGSVCAEINSGEEKEDGFNDYWLYDIAKIFDIKVDRTIYAIIGGWANRLNEIFPKLYCRNCKELLRPYAYAPITLGYYATPIFHCINPSCNSKDENIRFTHCLNGKCQNILDSRDCEHCCSTGLICNKCGTSCPSCSGYYQNRYIEY